MAEPAGPFHLLRAGPGRYLCYCGPGPGPGGSVYVTDALEVWAGELGARPPLGCRCPPEEHGAKLREALGRGAASLSLGEGKATLRLREEAARCSALDLFKLPIAEARSQLQALVFGMAGRVESLERRLEGMRQRHWRLPAALRRMLPGASSSSCQTPAPGKTGVLAQLCQPRGRSRASLSLTLASKARRHRLEWISRTPDLCCPIPDALSATCVLVEEVPLHPGPAEPLAPREADGAGSTQGAGASAWQARAGGRSSAGAVAGPSGGHRWGRRDRSGGFFPLQLFPAGGATSLPRLP